MRVFMLMYRQCMTLGEALRVFIRRGTSPWTHPRFRFSSIFPRETYCLELWFKVIERGRLSRATHEWFSSSLRFFSRSTCNVTLSNFLSWLRENFLPREESRRLLFKVKNCLYYNRFYNSKEKFAKFFIYCIKLNVLLYWIA